MKLSNSRALERKLEQLRKRSPWMASLITHCLENQNPRSCETMRTPGSSLGRRVQ